MRLVGLTASEVAALAGFMAARQDARLAAGPEDAGDLEVKLPGHDQPIPVVLDSVGNYAVFVALSKPPQSGCAADIDPGPIPMERVP